VIVLDASAVLELVLNTRAGRRVANRISPEDETLHAPHLLDLEVAQALRRYVRTGAVDASRAELALRHASELDLTRYDHLVLLPRIWALRDNLTAYDAAYVALAEALDAPLLTLDMRLATASRHNARIELIE
jgi:predicted nucleic acid-binding protein